MKQLFIIGFSLVAVLGFSTADARELLGQVILMDDDGRETGPGENLSVMLYAGHDSSGDRTIDGGRFRIALPNRVRAGYRYEIRVEKQGYEIFPTSSRHDRIPDNATLGREGGTKVVQLLPKGSLQFLSAAELRLMIAEAVTESQRQSTKDSRLDDFFEEWAKRYGFGLTEVNQAVEAWANEVQAHSKDLYEHGLADYTKRNYLAAAKSFRENAEYHEARAKTLAKQLKQHQAEAMQSHQFEGEALLKASKFAESREAFLKAGDLARSLQDPTARAHILTRLGMLFSQQAGRLEGFAVHDSWRASIASYREALELFSSEQDSRKRTLTQADLGLALVELSELQTGGNADRLLAQAVTYCREALAAADRKRDAWDWAFVRSTLSQVLESMATRRMGDEKKQLLTEAIEGYREALECYMRDAIFSTWISPKRWAGTLHDLGNALHKLAKTEDGRRSIALLEEAESCFEKALTVWNRELYPWDWANTQNSLGNAYAALARRSNGREASAHFTNALSGYRNALLVYVRTAYPQSWAMSTRNLANNLIDAARAGHARGNEKSWVLEARGYYNDVLQVYTRESFPVEWARTQTLLAAMLYNDLAHHYTDDEANQVLADAIKRLREVLTVRDRERTPMDWADTKSHLVRAYMRQSLERENEEAEKLLKQAEACSRATLEIHSLAAAPEDWVVAKHNQAVTQTFMANRGVGGPPIDRLTKAVTYYREILAAEDAGRIKSPNWRSYHGLANALVRQGTVRLSRAEDIDGNEFGEAVELYTSVLEGADPSSAEWTQAYGEIGILFHERLFLFDRARAHHAQWSGKHPDFYTVLADFAEAELTIGNYDACLEKLGQVVDADQELTPTIRSSLKVLEAICWAGQGNRKQANQAIKDLRDLVALDSIEFKPEWLWAGTTHFVKAEPQLQSSRDWLLKLIDAVSTEGGEQMLESIDGVLKELSDR